MLDFIRGESLFVLDVVGHFEHEISNFPHFRRPIIPHVRLVVDIKNYERDVLYGRHGVFGLSKNSPGLGDVEHGKVAPAHHPGEFAENRQELLAVNTIGAVKKDQGESVYLGAKNRPAAPAGHEKIFLSRK